MVANRDFLIPNFYIVLGVGGDFIDVYNVRAMNPQKTMVKQLVEGGDAVLNRVFFVW